jgi:hypothetical protein
MQVRKCAHIVIVLAYFLENPSNVYWPNSVAFFFFQKVYSKCFLLVYMNRLKLELYAESKADIHVKSAS